METPEKVSSSRLARHKQNLFGVFANTGADDLCICLLASIPGRIPCKILNLSLRTRVYGETTHLQLFWIDNVCICLYSCRPRIWPQGADRVLWGHLQLYKFPPWQAALNYRPERLTGRTSFATVSPMESNWEVSWITEPTDTGTTTRTFRQRPGQGQQPLLGSVSCAQITPSLLQGVTEYLSGIHPFFTDQTMHPDSELHPFPMSQDKIGRNDTKQTNLEGFWHKSFQDCCMLSKVGG